MKGAVGKRLRSQDLSALTDAKLAWLERITGQRPAHCPDWIEATLTSAELAEFDRLLDRIRIPGWT